MFRNKDERPDLALAETTTPELRGRTSQDLTRISLGTTVRGDIVCPGAMAIEGKVEGSVSAQGDVQVGSKGEVTGEIEARNITVTGRVNGKLYADDKVQLLPGSYVDGDIHSQSLKIEDSVYFHGGCNMGEGARRRRTESQVEPGSEVKTRKAA